ncbi:MAG: hypothetical protein JWP75_4126 [Frondihabitans sp.]|nr:hypothetical protein [Frondihabitans sp.]
MTTTETRTQDPDVPAAPAALSVNAPGLAGVYRRIVRRETHSSRSGAAIVILIILILVAAYVGIEAVYAGLGRRALLFSPLDVLATLRTAAATQGGLVIAVGIAAGIVGIVVIVIGLTPGRRGRHVIPDSRVAVVVDDQVIASSLARRARLAGSLAPDQVNAWVARNSARITLTPASGARADEEAVLEAARDELSAAGYQPSVQPQVRVSESGRLGA